MASARTLLEEKREEILRLAALHGAANVRVFGSVARGEDRDDSDIDLLVHMEDDRSLLDMIRFWDQVGSLLGRKVDVVDDESLHYVIRDEVLSQARPAVNARDRTYLIHIRDAIALIREYTGGGEQVFMSSRLHQDAVMRNFEIMGEAGGRLSRELRDNSPVAWQEIKAFRNFLAHQYMDVRPAMVWRIITNDLPALEAHVLSLLSES